MRTLPFVALLVSACTAPTPTDTQMRSAFQSNQSAFYQLRAKLCEFKEKRVIMMEPEWSLPLASASEKEIFYEMFKQVGARGVYYDGDCSFRLPVWSAGLAAGGSYKGYSYRPSNEWIGAVVETPLDNTAITVRGEKVFRSRPLGHDWYMYIQHWP
jgi:hypothetical protein